MDVCDPDAKTKNIRKLIKLHTGHTVDVSRERMCDITREAKKGNLPMPPLVLTRDKRFLLDSKSPLTQKDYETLYKSNTTSAVVKRLAKKVGLVNTDKTIADLKDAIGRRLASTGVREPILLPGSRAVSAPKSENFFVNANRNNVQNENRDNVQNENRNNVQNENRNNENRNRANINSARRNNGGRPNGNAVKPNGNRPKSVKNTIRNRHRDRIKGFGENRREPNRREPNRREPNRREPNGKKPGFFGRLFGGSKNTSTNKLNTEMKLAKMKRNTQRQVSHQRTVQSRLRLREAKLAKNAISEAEREKRQAINDVTRMQNNKHLLEVELDKRASNSRKKSNEAAKARRELAKEKLHAGKMNMGLANLRRRLRTRDTSLTNAVKNRDKLKKEFNEMKAGGDPVKIKEIQRKISVVDGKIKTQRKKKDAAQTAITSMAKRIRNGAQSNVESLRKKIETKEKSKLSREKAGLNFPDQPLLNKLKNDKGKAEQKLNRIKVLTNDRGLLNSANGSPEFRAAKDKEIAEAESSIKSLEDERKDLEKELAALKTAFSGQFSNGNRKNLQNRINAANKKIKNLEEELRKKPNKPNTPTPSPNKPNTPTPSPSPTNNNRIRKLEELMKLQSNLHVQVARGRLSNSEEMSFKTRINQMKNASQKTNIEEAIKRSTAAAKNARNVKRAQNIQSTKNRAREEAELKAKINIEKSKANAKREAVAEAQRRRNEKRKGKFNGLLKQFNGIINSKQKITFQERFNMAQEQRKLPKESRSNSASNIINKGGLAQIAADLRKIKANKNEATHQVAIETARKKGNANAVARQKAVYTQKRQNSFNKMVKDAKDRHTNGTNQRNRMNKLIIDLTTKFNSGQKERQVTIGPKRQSIINNGKIPVLAKTIRELEKDFINEQRAKNAKNIAIANAKATKAMNNKKKAIEGLRANRNKKLEEIREEKNKAQSEATAARKALVAGRFQSAANKAALEKRVTEAEANIKRAATEKVEALEEAERKRKEALEKAESNKKNAIKGAVAFNRMKGAINAKKNARTSIQNRLRAKAQQARNTVEKRKKAQAELRALANTKGVKFTSNINRVTLNGVNVLKNRIIKAGNAKANANAARTLAQFKANRKKAKENANRLAREKAEKAKQEMITKAKAAGEEKRKARQMANEARTKQNTRNAEANKATTARRIALEKKQAAAKQRREMQEQGRGKRNAEREAAKADAKKEKNNTNARMKTTRNKLAANKKVVSNLVGGAIKKAEADARMNAIIVIKRDYANTVYNAGKLITNKERAYWIKQGNQMGLAMSYGTKTEKNFAGLKKMFMDNLNRVKRNKNIKNAKNAASTKIQAAYKGAQVRKSVGGSSMGQDILKKHISGENVMARQTIPGFNGKRVENKGYESGWLNRVDKEGDTAVKRAKLRKMFDEKFELKKTLLKHENTNVRTGYRWGQLQSLKRQVMRPFSKKNYDSTKGTNRNEAILNAARIKKQIEEATSTHAEKILNQQRINMKKAGQKFKTSGEHRRRAGAFVRLGAGGNKNINGVNMTLNPIAGNTKSSKVAGMVTANNVMKRAPGVKPRNGFNGGIRLGAGGNKNINGVNMTLKRAKPSLKNITTRKVIRPARMAGNSLLKAGQITQAKKNAVGNVAGARKAYANQAKFAIEQKKKRAKQRVVNSLKGKAGKNQSKYMKMINAGQINQAMKEVDKKVGQHPGLKIQPKLT